MNNFNSGQDFYINFTELLHKSTENIANELSKNTIDALAETGENQNKLCRQRFLEMACLCRLAYIIYEQIPITITKTLQTGIFFPKYKFEEVNFLYSDDNSIFGDEPVCCGYMTLTNQEIIVVIRGTKNLEDWLLNFCISPNYQGFHSGFASYADSIWRQLNRLFSRFSYPQKKLTIVGHSLGGAAAILTAILLQKQEFNKLHLDEVEIYSFGSPPFSTKHISCQAPVYRIRTAKDLVPYLPQLLSKLGDWLPYIHESLFLYQHIWPEYIIDDNYEIYQINKSVPNNLCTSQLIQKIFTKPCQNYSSDYDFDPFSIVLKGIANYLYSEHQIISYIKKLNYGLLPKFLEKYV